MGVASLLSRPLARAPEEGVSMGRVIAFANQKGGVAKTTSTLNLAGAFAERDLDVLVVDLALANQNGSVANTTSTHTLAVACAERDLDVLVVNLDPQGNLTMSQGLNPDTIERSMFDVLVHRLPITEVIQRREIDLAVSSIYLAGAELALASMIGRERALEKALLPVRDKYDYILVDTPPSLGLLTINAFVASDGVIVPVH